MGQQKPTEARNAQPDREVEEKRVLLSRYTNVTLGPIISHLVAVDGVDIDVLCHFGRQHAACELLHPEHLRLVRGDEADLSRPVDRDVKPMILSARFDRAQTATMETSSYPSSILAHDITRNDEPSLIRRTAMQTIPGDFEHWRFRGPLTREIGATQHDLHTPSPTHLRDGYRSSMCLTIPTAHLASASFLIEAPLSGTASAPRMSWKANGPR